MPTTDNFNRADAVTLGANWTNQQGSIDIVSNQAKSTVDVAQAAFYSAVAFAAAQYSQVVAAVVGLTGLMGTTVRASSASPTQNYYLIGWTAGAGGQGLYKTVAGAATLLQSIAGNIVANDVIYLSVSGTTLVCKKNGVQLGTDQTDAAIASGSPGIFHNASAAIQGALDDWEGGDLVAATLRFFLSPG